MQLDYLFLELQHSRPQRLDACAGVEYAFLAHWSGFIGYRYMDFGTKRYNFAITSSVIAATNFTNWDIDQNIQTVDFGVNHHFGG